MLRENNSPDNVLTEDCIMHYLEVPKLSGKPEKEIEKWLYFIGHGDKEDETVRLLLSKDRMMEGLEEGAYRKALETARKLKDMGMTAEQIKEATGLEEPELGKLFS